MMTLKALFFMGSPQVEPAHDRRIRAMARESKIRPPLQPRVQFEIAPTVG